MSAKQAGPALERVPVEKATKAQLLSYAEVVAQLPEEKTKGCTADQLRELIKAAGYGPTIFVATGMAAPAEPGREGRLYDPADKRTDPEVERWFLVEFQPEYDIEGEPKKAQGFAAVNEHYCHFPKGLRIWMRECLYWAADSAQDVVYKEKKLPSPPGYPPRTKRVRTAVKQYPNTVLEIGGKVCETVPDVRDGEYIIAPKSSRAAVIAMQKQAELERSAVVYGDEVGVEGGHAAAQDRVHQQLAAQYAAA